MPTTPDIKDFRLAYLFRDLDRALLAQIAERACWRELDAGAPLFAKNDPGNRFYLVKTGTMKLFLLAEDGQEHVMELIGREHLFAEAVMFMGGRYPVYAAALEPTRLIAFYAGFSWDCCAVTLIPQASLWFPVPVPESCASAYCAPIRANWPPRYAVHRCV